MAPNDPVSPYPPIIKSFPLSRFEMHTSFVTMAMRALTLASGYGKTSPCLLIWTFCEKKGGVRGRRGERSEGRRRRRGRGRGRRKKGEGERRRRRRNKKRKEERGKRKRKRKKNVGEEEKKEGDYQQHITNDLTHNIHTSGQTHIQTGGKKTASAVSTSEEDKKDAAQPRGRLPPSTAGGDVPRTNDMPH